MSVNLIFFRKKFSKMLAVSEKHCNFSSQFEKVAFAYWDMV